MNERLENVYILRTHLASTYDRERKPSVKPDTSLCCRFLLTGRVTLTEKSDHLNYLNTASTRLHSNPKVTPAECLCLAMTYILHESKHTKLHFLLFGFFYYFMTFRSAIRLTNISVQGTQIPGTRSPRRLNFVRWRPMFPRPKQITYFYSPLILRMLVVHYVCV
jgi:hypothetical protein